MFSRPCRLAVLVLIPLALAAAAPQALAQTKTFRQAVKEWSDRELKDLRDIPDDVREAPVGALKKMWKAHMQPLEISAYEQLQLFIKTERERLRAMDDATLLEKLKAELKASGKLSAELADQVAQRMLGLIRALPDHFIAETIEEAAKEVAFDRMQRLRDSRISGSIVTTGEIPKTTIAETSRKEGTFGADDYNKLPIFPRITTRPIHEETLRTLFEQTFASRAGELKLTALQHYGLVDTTLGAFTYKDEFNRQHQGFGADFQLNTRFTVLNAKAESKRITLGEGEKLSLSAQIQATLVDLAAKVNVRSTNLVTPHGLISHNRITAGAGATSRIDVPITLDLFVVRFRVIPYAEAAVGAFADAHALIEVDWNGRLRLDIGAALSKGVGAGAGVILELELHPAVKAAIDKLIQEIKLHVVEPVSEFFRGIDEDGPRHWSTSLRFSPEELERLVPPEPGQSYPPGNLGRQQLAERYAPIIYQDVVGGRDAEADYLRRMDYDGNRSTLDNWNNLEQPETDRRGHVYYDVKETDTHYYIHYAFYHARRTSAGLFGTGLLKGAAHHENSMTGALVMVEKHARRGQEVVLVETYTGDGFKQYRNRPARTIKNKNARFDGQVRFIDEVDHGFVDLERTHPQLFVASRTHAVTGYNGRNDVGDFSGDTGVVYYPTGVAEAPRSARDKAVGYQLLPLIDTLWTHLEHRDRQDQPVFGRRIEDVAGSLRLPVDLAGNEGPDDSARAPWGWDDEARRRAWEERDREGRTAPLGAPPLPLGSFFLDPVATIKDQFVWQDLSARYLHNPYIGPHDGRPEDWRSLVPVPVEVAPLPPAAGAELQPTEPEALGAIERLRRSTAGTQSP